MSLKLEKIAAEREKARRKRDEWEERRKEWDRKYHEQENSEICEMVYAQLHLPIRVRMGRRIRLSVLLLRKQMWRKAQMQGKQTVTATSKSTRTCRCCRMATKSLRMRMGT